MIALCRPPQVLVDGQTNASFYRLSVEKRESLHTAHARPAHNPPACLVLVPRLIVDVERRKEDVHHNLSLGIISSKVYLYFSMSAKVEGRRDIV